MATNQSLLDKQGSRTGTCGWITSFTFSFPRGKEGKDVCSLVVCQIAEAAVSVFPPGKPMPHFIITMKPYQQAGAAGAAVSVILKAWGDPAFKAYLLDSPRAALAAVGVEYAPDITVAVHDNGGAGHYAARDFCGCYPTFLSPEKPSYWSTPGHIEAMRRDPAARLAALDVSVEPLTVVDTTADYLLVTIPPRPQHWERLSDDERAACVTSRAIVGHSR